MSFQAFGVAVFFIIICTLFASFITCLICKDGENVPDNLWIGFLLVILILSAIFGTFVTHPEDYGYTKINTVSENDGGEE